MAWDDIQTADDCITYSEWNNMVTQITLNECPSKGLLDFYLYSNCSDETGRKFKFTYSGDESQIIGGADTGDSLKILANSTDTYPFMVFEGDDYVEIKTTNDIYFYEQAEQMFKFSLVGVVSTIEGGTDTGDDLLIQANSTDDCSWAKFYGDGGIHMAIEVSSIFEVSTCSLETLWEIDASTPTDKHVDFHCLDAHNFVLEKRTSDPGSPCIGQIWFRTDLV